MDRKLIVVSVLLLAIAIAVLLVLPAFDVLPTAMRAWRAAKMLALTMTTLVLFPGLAPLVRLCGDSTPRDPFYACYDIVDLTCSRLC